MCQIFFASSVIYKYLGSSSEIFIFYCQLKSYRESTNRSDCLHNRDTLITKFNLLYSLFLKPESETNDKAEHTQILFLQFASEQKTERLCFGNKWSHYL